MIDWDIRFRQDRALHPREYQAHHVESQLCYNWSLDLDTRLCKIDCSLINLFSSSLNQHTMSWNDFFQWMGWRLDLMLPNGDAECILPLTMKWRMSAGCNVPAMRKGEVSSTTAREAVLHAQALDDAKENFKSEDTQVESGHGPVTWEESEFTSTVFYAAIHDEVKQKAQMCWRLSWTFLKKVFWRWSVLRPSAQIKEHIQWCNTP